MFVRPDKYNFEANVLNRWTGPGTSTSEPRASFGGYNYNHIRPFYPGWIIYPVKEYNPWLHTSGRLE